MANDPHQAGTSTISLGFANLTASIGDHIGHFFQSADEWRAVMVPFIKTGLLAGHKCVYVMSPEHSQPDIERSLAAEGIDIVAVTESRQLVLGEGRPTPEAMRSWLSDELADTHDRFSLMRWGGDMTWSLKQMPTSETLMKWETVCNCVEGSPAVFLCQYDLTQFRGDVVIDALRTHPLCIVGSVIQHNPFYVDPEQFLNDLDRRAASSGFENCGHAD